LSLYFFVLLFALLFAAISISFGGEDTVKLFDERQKFLVIVFNGDPRTEVVNPVAFFLVHATGSITASAAYSMFDVERMMYTG